MESNSDGEYMTDEQALFRDACLSGKPLAEFLSSRGISGQAADSRVGRWLTAGVCRGCGLPVTADDFDVWVTYWQSLWAPCHHACKSGMRREAIECQTVDADCNDCRHFERGKSAGELVQLDCANHVATLPANGHCRKHDRPTVASNNFCSGWPCFEHRRAN